MVEYLTPMIIIYAFVVGMFWFLPNMMGLPGWPIFIKLVVTITMIPAVYFIVPYMAER